MQVTETLSEGLKRGFAVTLPASDIEKKRSARLAEIGKSIRLPGFRPGKVPANLVRQRYGTAVMAEVLEESVNDATRQVLDERGLRPAAQPKVDMVGQIEDAKDLEFTVEVELLPEIAMPEFGAMELVRYKAEPDPAAVDKALAEIASRQEGRAPVTEDRGAQAGDTLTVDFLGKVDGVAFSGGSGTDMPVKLGAAGFIPGFADGMTGMKPGESRTIEVTFPAEYHAAELAGKAATFDVTAKALDAPVPADMNEELAQKIGFDSLEELRGAIEGRIRQELEGISRMRIKRDLLDALARAVTFPVPASMADAEFDAIWKRIEEDRAAGRLDEEDRAKDEDTLRAEYRAIAERRVRLGLLLSEIGRVNGIQVQDAELTRAMRAEAGRYPGQEAQVMEFFRKNKQAADGLRGPIYEDKVIDFILELAKVEDRTVTPEELSAEPEAAAARVENGGETVPG